MTTPTGYYHIMWTLPSGVDVNDYYYDPSSPPEMTEEVDGMCHYVTSCYFNYYTHNTDEAVCEDLCHLDYFTDKFRSEYDSLCVGCFETSCV